MKNYIDGLQFGVKVIGYIKNDVMDYANKHDIISINKSDFEYLIRCAEEELSTEENIFNLENKETELH